MESRNSVTIELVSGTLTDYLIKDKNKILIGKFSVVDLDKSNKKCNIRLKFYREDNYELLTEALKQILKVIFKDSNVFKINFIVSERINIKAFSDLGFTLEAILTNNLFIKGEHLDELGFGISRYEYGNLTRNNAVHLEGKNITIRNFSPGDAEELLEYYVRNKEHLKEFEPTRDDSFYTKEAQKDMLIDSYKQFMIGTGVDLGIYINEKLIGKIKVSNIVYGVFKSGILGYSIDKNYQGKGYMKEAVNLVIEYANEELDLHRLEASVLLENSRSKAVLESCDFEEVGINKEYLYINGKWRDHRTFYKIIT